jgi:hypothetical protein
VVKQQQFLKLCAVALSQDVTNTKEKKKNVTTASSETADNYSKGYVLGEKADDTKEEIQSEKKREASKPLYLKRYE